MTLLFIGPMRYLNTAVISYVYPSELKSNESSYTVYDFTALLHMM